MCGILLSFGLLGNLIVLIVFSTKAFKKFPSRNIYRVLVILDSINIIYRASVELLFDFSKIFSNTDLMWWYKSELLGKIFFYLQEFFASQNLLVFISIEKFISLRYPHNKLIKNTNSKLEDQYIFRAILDIKKEDQKNPSNYISVPKDKEAFKLRKNIEKQIVIQIQQLTNQTVEIERCFGVLMCPGRNVSHKDMQLLQTISMGLGNVSKDCAHEELLDWSDLLYRWRKNTWNERPRGLQSLVRKGIPEALRGEVWQLLAGCNENEKSMNESYRFLMTKESPSENIIVRDINRTFTGHQFFQDENGQQALYKLSKAYSIYDEEVGYCQGLSFLIASLLLHMPEEQTFNLLVKIMYRYEVREIYKTNFESLHLRFYQLENLMRDYLPELHEHFVDLNIEAHMFASQWFLTLFTAKFPLYMVFRVLDLFLKNCCIIL